jgi:serine/threonine protein phosphatase 1
MRSAPGWLAPGRRIYAVGDVHGCAARLDQLHAEIAADLADRPVPQPQLIHLGDMIDRGPDSAGVIARLATGSPLPGVPMVVLRGNHEQMMLDAMGGDPAAVDHWRGNGGDAALQSWGVKRPKKNPDWPLELPPQDYAFLRALPLTHIEDGYLFVHAGVRPGITLARQSAEDLLWIRRPFLHSTGPLLPEAPRLAAVHGHTPEPAPSVTDNRIGVDTGAVRGGRLTCAVLEGDQVSFIAV